MTILGEIFGIFLALTGGPNFGEPNQAVENFTSEGLLGFQDDNEEFPRSKYLLF